MCGIKLLPQDFALNMEGGGVGLMREALRGVFAGHYGILKVITACHYAQSGPNTFAFKRGSV